MSALRHQHGLESESLGGAGRGYQARTPAGPKAQPASVPPCQAVLLSLMTSDVMLSSLTDQCTDTLQLPDPTNAPPTPTAVSWLQVAAVHKSHPGWTPQERWAQDGVAGCSAVRVGGVARPPPQGLRTPIPREGLLQGRALGQHVRTPSGVMHGQ